MSSNNDQALVMLTCYDASFSRILADSGQVDYLLVGDSLGNVICGEANTHQVTMEQILHHVRAVAKGIENSQMPSKPLLIADMPIGSYATPELAQTNGAKLLEAGAQIVKVEGPVTEIVWALRSKDIRVCAHIGLTPQTFSEYKVQGKKPEDAERLIKEARALEKSGAELIVLELMPASLGKEITASLKIPTIGIGAGAECSGQVLVLYDLLGFNPDFQPKFLKKYADGYSWVRSAVEKYSEEVKARQYPGEENSFR